MQVHKNPDQVNKFIKQIISENHTDVFIHIDKKSKNLESKIMKNPRVKILEENIDVQWGDITQVDAALLLFENGLSSRVNYDFVCFRSGQDLLVKNGFTDFLSKNKNKIFMNAYLVSKRDSHASFVKVRWPDWARRLYIAPFHPLRVIRRLIASLYGLGINLIPNKNKLPKDFSIYNCSNWFCIPLEVVKFITSFLEKNNWYYEVFKNSLVPDEFFFQTLIMNSKYKSHVINNNLMYIKFGESIKTRNNPIALRMKHVDTIRRSNEYFARKFDESIDHHVIDYFAEAIRM